MDLQMFWITLAAILFANQPTPTGGPLAPVIPEVVATSGPLTPVAAPAKPTAYELIDAGKFDELAERKPKTLLKELRKGRKFAKFLTGQSKRDLDDGFGRETDLYLYVPRKPTGVLILLHGLQGNGGQLIEFYQKLAERAGLIIAAPTAQKLGKIKNEDWAETSEQLMHWWSYRPEGFALAALSTLKKEFPINENRVYISGYSMGGFGSWNLGLRFPDRFAAAAPVAGGISMREYQIERDDQIRKLLPNAVQLPFYFIHGDSDNTVSPRFDRMTRDELRKLRVPHKYVEVPRGSHFLDMRPEGTIMKGLSSWMLKKARNPHPRGIRFYSFGEYMNQCYWIRIDEFEGDGPATVTATIGKRNKISIESEGASKITVFLDEKLIKLRSKVEIEVNDTVAFKGRVKEDSQVVVESWRTREDRELLYSAKVEIDIAALTDSSKE